MRAPGVAFHVVETNQECFSPGHPGLEAKAHEAGTIWTGTAINGEAVEPFLAPIVILPSA